MTKASPTPKGRPVRLARRFSAGVGGVLALLLLAAPAPHARAAALPPTSALLGEG